MKKNMRGRNSPPAVPALSFFTGAGGLDLGVREAGFEPAIAIEADADARETLANNWPRLRLAEPGDVHELSIQQIEEQSGLRPSEVGLIFGGPPCQPFSKAALWHAGKVPRLKDPRAKTLTAMMDSVKHFLPDVLLIENVSGLAAGRGSGVSYVKRRLAEINRESGTLYRPSVFVLNAVDFGVPQTRERLFIVAARSGQRVSAPTPTHFAPDHALSKNSRWRTCWDALGHLSVDPNDQEALVPRGKWAELLPSIPEGNNYLWHTDRGGGVPIFGWRRRYWTFLLKLAKNRPAWTIAANPGPATGPFHWTGRQLSVPELAALQTFPESYRWPEKYRVARAQIGNAVPPALAAVVAAAIRVQCFDGLEFDCSRLVPAARSDCPSPDRIAKAPERLRDLQLDRSPHPGTGLGPGAEARLL